MRTLVNLLRLRPYGKNLSDGAADIWLLFAILSIGSVAVCDAIAWAYLGYTTATGWGAYVSTAIAGVIALMLVGSLDATFVMQDTAQHHGSVTDTSIKGSLSWLRAHVRRNHLAVAVRIILVILSFTVTAPFLTQLFFARDIAAAIERSNAQSIALKRSEVAAKYDAKLTELSGRVATRSKDLEAEVAGTGQSARFGEGPTARAIREEIKTLQAEIGNTHAARAAELNVFDNATPDVREARYGVDLQREGPDTRARVVAEMEKSPAFRATRRTIKAFLLFLFLSLVSLKLFQPASVKVYFNAELQAAYERLKAGIFDGQLDPREHGGSGMAPLHFARWYEQHQRVREATEALRERAAEVTERLRVREQAYTAVQENLTRDLARMHEDLTAVTQTGEDLEQKLAAARAELALLKVAVQEQEEELRDFAQLRDDLPLRERQFLIDGRMKTAKVLASNRVRANELTAGIAKLTAQLDTNRNYRRTISLSIEEAGRDLVDVNRLIAEARQQSVRDLT